MPEKGKGPKGGAPPAEKGEVTIDFSGVRPFDPLREDLVYLTTVDKMDLGQGPKGKKVHVELVVNQPEEIEIETESGTQTIKVEGRRLFREYSLAPQALPFFHEMLRALGEKDLGSSFKFNSKNYLGEQVAVKVKNEEFEEQIRSRVNKVLPASAYTG